MYSCKGDGVGGGRVEMWKRAVTAAICGSRTMEEFMDGCLLLLLFIAVIFRNFVFIWFYPTE